jgi:hypothetical protein
MRVHTCLTRHEEKAKASQYNSADADADASFYGYESWRMHCRGKHALANKIDDEQSCLMIGIRTPLAALRKR